MQCGVAQLRGPISHFKTWFWLNDFELKSAAVCAHYFDCSNFKIILFYISACCSLHSEQNPFQKWQNVCNAFWSKRLKKCILKRSINFYFWGTTYSIEQKQTFRNLPFFESNFVHNNCAITTHLLLVGARIFMIFFWKGSTKKCKYKAGEIFLNTLYSASLWISTY